LEGLFLPAALIWNRARMRLPYAAACERCSVRNPLVLPTERPVLCYRCDAQERGLSGEEGHHIGGRPSLLPTERIDANLHRVVSVFQETWRQRDVRPGTTTAVVFDLVLLATARRVWRKDGG
jgi:hypothetical protein